MNPEELRIGTIVYVPGLFQISNITETIQTISISGEIETKSTKAHISAYEPVEITEEWLKKLKFNKDKDRDSFYLDIEEGYNKFDLMWFEGVVYLKSRYHEENLNCQAFPHIKYVHQLQNLIHIVSNNGEYLRYYPDMRELFIKYQEQYYNESNMYDLIAQSDQNRAIRSGSYDDHILKNTEKILKYNE